MTKVIKVIYGIFNFVVGLFAFVLLTATLVFFILWQSGFVEEHYPALYCFMAKNKQDKMVRQTDSTIAVIHYDSHCECDTSYYYKNNPVNATAQQP